MHDPQEEAASGDPDTAFPGAVFFNCWGVMNHEPSQNRGPRAESSSRRDHGSGQQEEIIRAVPEGEWLGYRRRTPGHFSLAAGASVGRFFALGRGGGSETAPVF